MEKDRSFVKDSYRFVRSSTPDLSTDIKESSGRDLNENKDDRYNSRYVSKTTMPVRDEANSLQCWRCKGYGHRPGDRECVLSHGNGKLKQERTTHQDTTTSYVNDKLLRRQEKYERVEQLMQIMDEIRREEADRKAKKKEERKRHKHSKRSREQKSERKESKKVKI